MTTYSSAFATLGPRLETHERVCVDVHDGRISRVDPRTDPRPGAQRLGDQMVPGLANCHSHVFHRALRGRTHGGAGTFWTWRERMYALAAALDPDLLHDLARATYAEMASAGYTAVGEFHYLHHRPDGTAYDDPNATGEALVEAARAVGIRIALLDTCYLSAGFGRPVEGVQRRFCDGDATRWAERVEALHATYAASPDVVVGAAIHSVRAVPADQLRVVAEWARGHDAPLHVHLSEQPAENDECVAHHGLTPTGLLAEHGVWGPRTTAVHATHLSDADIETLGAATAYACFCPTTERELADGVGPSVRLRDAGVRLTLGSDSHAVIDPFEEARAVELDERLVSGRRGAWSATELLRAGTASGHASLGFKDAGVIGHGRVADLVGVNLGSVRTAGASPGAAAVVFAAGAADVSGVLVGGRRPDVDATAGLQRAVERCWAATEEDR